MTDHTSRARALPALGIVMAMALAACQGSGAATDGGSGEGAEIFASGSSTVEPITNAVAEAYAAETDGFEYTVEGPGTGDGFALFCNDETDISDASRAISEEEAATCEENGVEYV